ncbi:unnamed protein product [Moneuplotes crassus]|uniref:Uncharacterized protein n=1 Tax=Euplotes crassus TaxID=5936 RepID=A0AAD1XHW0_EUPCR|nr:unnamed protein product [Moneuplotes crassus]
MEGSSWLSQEDKEKVLKEVSLERSEKFILKETCIMESKFIENLYFKNYRCELESEMGYSSSRRRGTCCILEFSLDNCKEAKFLHEIKCCQSLNYSYLGFHQIKIRNMHFINEFAPLFLGKVDNLTLFSEYEPIPKIGLSNSILRWSARVLGEVLITWFNINARQFKRLMASYRHVNAIKLHYCKISVPAYVNFSKALKNTKIKSISIVGTGEHGYSDWKNNPDEFKNLVQSLASSPDLKMSIEKINIEWIGVEEDEAQEILRDNGLVSIES